MLLILYGPDTYRSRRKLNEIIEEYRKKVGTELNLHRFDVEEKDPATLKNLVETQSLFASKKLIIVEHALSHVAAFETVEPMLKNAADSRDVVIVLWDRELDEKGKKQLKKIEKLTNKVQEFKPLSRGETQRWISDEAKKRGVRLYPALLTQFDMLGPNLWALSNELDKLAVSGPQTTNHKPQTNINVFSVGDTFFSSREAALRNTLQLLHQGHDDHNLFAYLSNHTRTLLTVKSFAEKRQPVPNSFGIHPFVVKKASSLVRPLSIGNIQSFVHRFFEEDFKIKIGLSRPRDSVIRILMR